MRVHFVRLFLRSRAARLAALAAVALLAAGPGAADPPPASLAEPEELVSVGEPAMLPDASEGDDASCRARSEARARARASVEDLHARMRAMAEGEDAPVMLNGRGYNYAPQGNPWQDLDRVEREAARAR